MCRVLKIREEADPFALEVGVMERGHLVKVLEVSIWKTAADMTKSVLYCRESREQRGVEVLRYRQGSTTSLLGVQGNIALGGFIYNRTLTSLELPRLSDTRRGNTEECTMKNVAYSNFLIYEGCSGELLQPLQVSSVTNKVARFSFQHQVCVVPPRGKQVVNRGFPFQKFIDKPRVGSQQWKLPPLLLLGPRPSLSVSICLHLSLPFSTPFAPGIHLTQHKAKDKWVRVAYRGREDGWILTANKRGSILLPADPTTNPAATFNTQEQDLAAAAAAAATASPESGADDDRPLTGAKPGAAAGGGPAAGGVGAAGPETNAAGGDGVPLANGNKANGGLGGMPPPAAVGGDKVVAGGGAGMAGGTAEYMTSLG